LKFGYAHSCSYLCDPVKGFVTSIGGVVVGRFPWARKKI